VPVPALERILGAEAPESRALGFAALGRLGRLVDARLLEAGLADPSPAVRTAALQAAARSGLPGLADLCRRHTASEALAFLGLLGDRSDRAHLETAVGGDPERSRAALRGLAALGCVGAVPALLAWMDDAALAVPAAGAFRRITGAEGLEADGGESARQESDAGVDSEDVEAEFADDAAPPDPVRARAWWQARAAAFAPEGRWQAGAEVARPGSWSLDLPLGLRRDLWLSERARDLAATPDLELEARGAGV